MLDHHQTMGRRNLRGGTKGIHSSREAAGAKIKQGKGSGAEERGQREKGRERDQANQQTSTNQAIKPTKQRREGRETRGVGRA